MFRVGGWVVVKVFVVVRSGGEVRSFVVYFLWVGCVVVGIFIFIFIVSDMECGGF